MRERCTSDRTTGNEYANFTRCMADIENEVAGEWDSALVQFPCLKAYDSFDGFVEYGRLSRHPRNKTPEEEVFLCIAKDYSIFLTGLSAKLLLLLARDILSNYHHNHRYMRILTEPIDRWNCIVEGFLQTVKMHGRCYDYRMLYKFMRAAFERENRAHKAKGNYKITALDESIMQIPDYSNNNLNIVCTLIYREYVEWLHENLNHDEWEVIEKRCIFEEDCQTFAIKHNKTYAASKKLLTRAKTKAVKILGDRFPGIAFAIPGIERHVERNRSKEV